MKDNILYEKIIRIKSRIVMILILLSILLPSSFVILPEVAYDFNYIIPNSGFKNTFDLLIIIIGIYFINVIYRFLNLYKEIKNYGENMLMDERGQNLILLYKRYSKTRLFEKLFYLTIMMIYMYILISILKML